MGEKQGRSMASARSWWEQANEPGEKDAANLLGASLSPLHPPQQERSREKAARAQQEGSSTSVNAPVPISPLSSDLRAPQWELLMETWHRYPQAPTGPLLLGAAPSPIEALVEMHELLWWPPALAWPLIPLGICSLEHMAINKRPFQFSAPVGVCKVGLQVNIKLPHAQDAACPLAASGFCWAGRDDPQYLGR